MQAIQIFTQTSKQETQEVETDGPMLIMKIKRYIKKYKSEVRI